MVLVVPYSLVVQMLSLWDPWFSAFWLVFCDYQNIYLRDFPGGLVVMNPRFHYRGSIPGWGTKIPACYAIWPK